MKRPKSIAIRKSQMRVLCKRLFSSNVFDIPLIEAVSSQLAIELPDAVYEMEVWKPMDACKTHTVYEIMIVVSETVVSTTSFTILLD